MRPLPIESREGADFPPANIGSGRLGVCARFPSSRVREAGVLASAQAPQPSKASGPSGVPVCRLAAAARPADMADDAIDVDLDALEVLGGAPDWEASEASAAAASAAGSVVKEEHFDAKASSSSATAMLPPTTTPVKAKTERSSQSSWGSPLGTESHSDGEEAIAP